jgi:hypothetical protein
MPKREKRETRAQRILVNMPTFRHTVATPSLRHLAERASCADANIASAKQRPYALPRLLRLLVV